MPKLFIFICLLLMAASKASAAGSERTPVIFDTDIGTDIDDAYALALLIRRADIELLGVTTVSGDTAGRARLAAKLLASAGGPAAKVPVFAGIPGPDQYMAQAEWAREFRSPRLHEAGAIDFMRRQIEARPGEITLIAVGELTNVAALLDISPGIAGKIKAIALMGGSIYRGYAPGSKPEPEWNIKSNVAAARRVFGAGAPLIVAPLDSTADLVVTPEMRVKVFSHGVPLTDALASLNSIWRHTNTWKAENPTLFDALAVALVAPRRPFELRALHIDVEADGLTRATAAGAPNAEVALEVDAPAFMREVVNDLTR